MDRWIVVENTPGYLPDSEPAGFPNRKDANRYAAELARTLREDGYVVYGSAQSGYYAAEMPGDAYDLGRVIEVHENWERFIGTRIDLDAI